MGQAHGQAEHGGMDIHDQKETFHGFLVTTVWTCTLIAQYVALFTLAFAIGSGWWAGLAAFLVIGVGSGMIFKMAGAWWAVLVAQLVLLGLGGVVIPLLSSLMA